MTKRYDDLPGALKGEIRLMAGVVHERLLAAELRKVLSDSRVVFGTSPVLVAGALLAFEAPALTANFEDDSE